MHDGNTDYPLKRNATGFSALPGGLLDEDGFVFDGDYWLGYWRTAREYNTTDAWFRGIAHWNTSETKHTVEKGTGMSVRCVKD